MKANEAPEKIYILKHSDYSDIRLLNAFTEKETNNDIEYTRTDAFIEKAVEWIKYNGSHYIAIVNGQLILKKSIVKDFKNYMKGK